MTDSYTPGTPELLPCPFCGDAMQANNSGTFGHTGSAADCIIGQLAWEHSPRFIAFWNTRSCNLHGELVAALEEVAENFEGIKNHADNGDTQLCWETARDGLERARSILAKARGQS